MRLISKLALLAVIVVIFKCVANFYNANDELFNKSCTVHSLSLSWHTSENAPRIEVNAKAISHLSVRSSFYSIEIMKISIFIVALSLSLLFSPRKKIINISPKWQNKLAKAYNYNNRCLPEIYHLYNFVVLPLPRLLLLLLFYSLFVNARNIPIKMDLLVLEIS